MTDSVEAIVAHMREAAAGSREIGTSLSREIAGLLTSFADRLQSAHDAEVGALRAEVAMLAESEGTLENAAAAMTDLKARAESAESRLREAERDAGLLAASLAGAFAGMDMVGPPDTMRLIQKWDCRIDHAMEGEDG